LGVANSEYRHQIRKVAGEGKLKAYVTVTLKAASLFTTSKVIQGESGVFIAMPSRRTKNGEYKMSPIRSTRNFGPVFKSRFSKAYDQAADAL